MKKTALTLATATLLAGLTVGASAAPMAVNGLQAGQPAATQIRMMRSERMMMKKRMMRKEMMKRRMMNRM